MSSERKVAIITGAFARHRRRSGQGVSGPQLSGRGDLPFDRARPAIRTSWRSAATSAIRRPPRRVARAGDRAIRADRHAGQQCRHLHRQAVHRLHGRGFQRQDRDQPRRLLPHHAAGRGRDAEAGIRPHRQHHHEPRRSCGRRCADRARQPDQGRHQLGHQGAGDRIRHQGHPRERRLPGYHQDPDAPGGDPRIPGGASPDEAAWARSRTSSTPCCSWNRPVS